jgi:hypothetical protein
MTAFIGVAPTGSRRPFSGIAAPLLDHTNGKATASEIASPYILSVEGVNMAVAPINPFVIETEAEADEFLSELFQKPEYRSLDEAIKRAQP